MRRIMLTDREWNMHFFHPTVCGHAWDEVWRPSEEKHNAHEAHENEFDIPAVCRTQDKKQTKEALQGKNEFWDLTAPH